MGRQEQATIYAAARAKLLLGCYRTGDANDPETYVAAITAVLARYPEEVITSVSHPATGLPSKKTWLPSVKEVTDACEEIFEPIKQRALREKRIEEQLAAREENNKSGRPTYDQLKAKYGDNWGIAPPKEEKTAEQKAAENRSAIESAKARVRSEYEERGEQYPGSLAASYELRRILKHQDELRAAIASRADGRELEPGLVP